MNLFKKSIQFSLIRFQRGIKKEVRVKMKEKQSAKHTALEYFDFFYSSSFGMEWNKIRLAMLTGSKYTALINNYSLYTDTLKQMNDLTALNLFEFALRDKTNLSELKIPTSLKVFCFDNGDTRQFPSPIQTNNKLLNYYCMDGASLLPVIALDIQKGESVLDLCAAPGGKTLAMLQTMKPSKIICRDISVSRIERLERMLKSYINETTLNKLIKIELNMPKIGLKTTFDQYDKILVDVPCTNDRVSLFKNDNNIFSKYRVEERTQLPQLQAKLLKQAIESCKLNGSIVYSTCSLSPIQNEGVINTVVNSFNDQNNLNFKLEITNLDYIKHNLDYFFTFSNSCSKGLLVTPEITKNFGPFYLCKINKICK